MRPNCDFGEHVPVLEEAYNKFINDKNVKKMLHDPDEAFHSLLMNEFKMNPEHFMFQKNIGKGQIKGLEQRLDNLVKNIGNGKLSGKLAELFYTPSSFANSDPTVSKLMNDYVHAGQYHKGADRINLDRQVRIKNSLRREAKSRGFIGNSFIEFGKKLTFQTAESKMSRHELKMEELATKAKNGDKEAEVKYREMVREEMEIVKDSQMEVYAELIGYIESESGLTKLVNDKAAKGGAKWETKRKKGEYFLDESDFIRLLDKDGKPISGDMKQALHEYTMLTEDLYHSLSDGVGTYIRTVMEGQTTKTKEQLTSMHEKLTEKLMPNPEKGFYPHFRRGMNVDFMDGLMGKLEDLVLSSNKYFDTTMTMQTAIDNINGFVSGHTKSREVEVSAEDYSMNFPKVMQSYSNNVTRFNYINQINLTTKKALTQLEGLYKKGHYEGGYGESVIEFVQDLHKSATGYDQVTNPVVNNMLRTLLGFEFISKIGFNPRSAVRNLSQSLLNLVEWSPLQIKESRDFFSDAKKLSNIEAEMESLGILFKDSAPELVESMGRTPGGASSVKLNPETGKLEHIPLTRLDKITGIVGNVAAKSGYMTAKVENFNRKTTFKIGYAQMHKSLDNVGFFDMIAAKNPKLEGEALANKVESARKLAAKQYAINMTVGLHFDYNTFSKSKILRSKVGSVVGQFQHYSFKFIEKNAEVMRKAKNDMMVGDVTGNEAMKLYRMAIVYFLAPAIASAITGVDVGGIIEHDAAEKVNKLAIGLTGDPDEIRKAFHNKGPVIGTIGFPLYSDIMNFGMMKSVVNMDDNSLAALIAGYDDAHAQELEAGYKKDKLYSMTRLLNVGANRFLYRHLPQLAEGNIGWAFQSELAIYPTTKARNLKKKAEALSPEMFEALKALEKRGR